MKKLLYAEKQIMDTWWMRLIFLFPSLLIWSILVFQILTGTSDTSNFTLVAIGVLTLGLTLLMWNSRLRTDYYEDKIVFRFWPFHLKEKEILWSDVKSIKVVKYSPLRDYGGWGIRIGVKGNAFNVKGNLGVLLEMKKGRSTLFSTQEPKEVYEALKALKMPVRYEIE